MVAPFVFIAILAMSMAAAGGSPFASSQVANPNGTQAQVGSFGD